MKYLDVDISNFFDCILQFPVFTARLNEDAAHLNRMTHRRIFIARDP